MSWQMNNQHKPKFKVGDKIVHISADRTDMYHLVTEICSFDDGDLSLKIPGTDNYVLKFYVDGEFRDKDFPLCEDAD
jgi:hypothetical protein